MKAPLIIIVNFLILGVLGFILFLLNSYPNGLFLPKELEGGMNYIMRFILLNLESFLLLFFLSKITKEMDVNSSFLEWVLILDGLIICVISAILFYIMYHKGI